MSIQGGKETIPPPTLTVLRSARHADVMAKHGQISAIRILGVIAFLSGAIVFGSPLAILGQASEIPDAHNGQVVEYNNHGHHVFMTGAQIRLVQMLPVVGFPIFISGFALMYFADRRES